LDLSHIKEGDDAQLKALYHLHRPVFMAWFRKNSNFDDALYADWYQESFFIFFENVRTGKLATLEVGLSTYLIAIGKNIQRDYLKSASHQNNISENQFDITKITSNSTAIHQDELEHIKKAMETLGAKCREILNLYYYRNFSMDEIAKRMEFKNEAVAKKSKYNCLQKLRKAYREL
jgi:RNA polymerase sigma factor (sigma-70 family)